MPLPSLLLLLTTATVAFTQDSRPAPFLDARTHKTEYVGPGREASPPQGLTEIRLAFFGPADPEHPDWGEAWRGAVIAIEEANAAGGHQGLPFRLLSAWSESPWGSGVADLAKLVFTEGVWAVVGGIDGVTTHLAEQIVVKARLPLLSPGCTDPSVNFTNVAWMFTLLANDDRLAPLLVREATAGRTDASWSAVTTADRDFAAAWRAVRAEVARQHARAPAFHLALPPATPDYGPAVADVTRSDSRSVLVLAGARDAARIAKALRSSGFKGRIVVGATAGRRVFLQEAGPCAEGVVFPLLFDTESPSAEAFVSAYEMRWASTPDYLAAYTYDATRLLVHALRRAGLNRALIRDALETLTPWDGVVGTVTWDPTGRNTRPVTMGVWRGGHSHGR